MKIILNTSIASTTWSYKRGTIIDTLTNQHINQAEAIRFLTAGIASPVKETEKPAKQTAVRKKKNSEES